MISEKYRIAVSETLDILKHTNKQDVDKISPRFIKFLNENQYPNYKSNLDHNKEIKDMNLSKETLGILGIIYRKFWCNDEQRQSFDKALIKNQIKHEKELREKYNPEDLFKKEEGQTDKESKITSQNEIATINHKNTLFSKIIMKIKTILKR